MQDGKIQTFPSQTWRNEFLLANQIGYELVEWVLDNTDIHENPLLSKKGRLEINDLSKRYNIEIPSICCDYFVEFPLHSADIQVRMQALGMLNELIRIAPEIGAKYLEIPLIGKSSIKDPEAEKIVLEIMHYAEDALLRNGVSLLLETDITPDQLNQLFISGRIQSNGIGLNYDTGNSAYWEFDTKYELSHYGDKIGNIHIKDCTPKDYSVMLGEGNVDFDLTFQMLKELDYKGDFIVQAVRGQDDVMLAEKFYHFTKDYIKKYLV
jgi:L-ribulose-5-phosphate 3-epimerase UlaE